MGKAEEKNEVLGVQFIKIIWTCGALNNFFHSLRSGICGIGVLVGFITPVDLALSEPRFRVSTIIERMREPVSCNLNLLTLEVNSDTGSVFFQIQRGVQAGIPSLYIQESDKPLVQDCLASLRKPRSEQCLGLRSAVGVGQKKSLEMALKHFEKASRAGDKWSERQIPSLLVHMYGANTPPAAEMLRRRAAAGDALAARYLANLFVMKARSGEEQAAEQAKVYYRKAAELGDGVGRCQVGVELSTGPVQKRDYATARRYFQEVAKMGDPDAMSNLGLMYELGRGGEPDMAAAVVWYRAAADQGGISGIRNLGIAYEHGWGVPADPVRADKLYRSAAAQGDWVAKHKLSSSH